MLWREVRLPGPTIDLQYGCGIINKLRAPSNQGGQSRAAFCQVGTAFVILVSFEEKAKGKIGGISSIAPSKEPLSPFAFCLHVRALGGSFSNQR